MLQPPFAGASLARTGMASETRGLGAGAGAGGAAAGSSGCSKCSYDAPAASPSASSAGGVAAMSLTGDGRC